MQASECLLTLEEIEAFKTLPQEHLHWLCEKSELRELQQGEYLFRQGDPTDYMHVLLKGRIEITQELGGHIRQIGLLPAGSITGVLPFSRMKEATGSGLALEETVVMSLHREHFREMEMVSPEMVQVLVEVMSNRIRDFTSRQQQNEKLVALGKLSAGLAHELNNPASAIVRSANELNRHLHLTPERFKKVIKMKVTDEQVDAVNDVLFNLLETCKLQHGLSLLQRTAQEDELADWLDAHKVPDSYSLAEGFVASGLHVTQLEQINAILNGEFLAEVLQWVDNLLTTERLVEEIQEASERIAKLVSSVKTYTHMDRDAGREPTDLHSGIRSTLTMLGHKIRQKQVQVKESFAADLPPVMGYAGELNQVWTNLIDNALDAVPAQGGKLEIATRLEGGFVKVEVIDNGTGIPEANLSRIFEPFFTTKAIGQGTGLGLDIVKKIMDQHNADIKVQSQPGRTAFNLCFPISG